MDCADVLPCKNDLDQIHIPDPVSQELCRLREQLRRLEEEIDRIKTEESQKESE